MAGINKWKAKKHFEVLISCTENKTKEPTQKQEGEDAFQPPARPWWVSGFSSSPGWQLSCCHFKPIKFCFSFPIFQLNKITELGKKGVNPTLEPALCRSFLWDTMVIGCLVFIAGTEMCKLKMCWIQVKKFLVLCGMEGKEQEEIQKSSLSFCWACRELSWKKPCYTIINFQQL